jgi:hypothetical protein
VRAAQHRVIGSRSVARESRHAHICIAVIACAASSSCQPARAATGVDVQVHAPPSEAGSAERAEPAAQVAEEHLTVPLPISDLNLHFRATNHETSWQLTVVKESTTPEAYAAHEEAFGEAETVTKASVLAGTAVSLRFVGGGQPRNVVLFRFDPGLLARLEWRGYDHSSEHVEAYLQSLLDGNRRALPKGYRGVEIGGRRIGIPLGLALNQARGAGAGQSHESFVVSWEGATCDELAKTMAPDVTPKQARVGTRDAVTSTRGEGGKLILLPSQGRCFVVRQDCSKRCSVSAEDLALQASLLAVLE